MACVSIVTLLVVDGSEYCPGEMGPRVRTERDATIRK